jgi:hypothetical protein
MLVAKNPNDVRSSVFSAHRLFNALETKVFKQNKIKIPVALEKAARIWMTNHGAG